MIQVWTTPYGKDVATSVNEWLADRDHRHYQVLDIQYVMGSEYGRTDAMIIYEDDPEPSATLYGEPVGRIKQLPSKQ